MNHLIWIDLINGTFEDGYFCEHTKQMIEHYEYQGLAQILKAETVKEDVK